MDKNEQQCITIENNGKQFALLNASLKNLQQWITIDNNGQQWITIDNNG